MDRPTPERERLIREGFCFDSDRDCQAARDLIAEIDTLRVEGSTVDAAISRAAKQENL